MLSFLWDGQRMTDWRLQRLHAVRADNNNSVVCVPDASSLTGLPDIISVIGRRWYAVFRHVRRLRPDTPAHKGTPSCSTTSSRHITRMHHGEDPLVDHVIPGSLSLNKHVSRCGPLRVLRPRERSVQLYETTTLSWFQRLIMRTCSI